MADAWDAFPDAAPSGGGGGGGGGSSDPWSAFPDAAPPHQSVVGEAVSQSPTVRSVASSVHDWLSAPDLAAQTPQQREAYRQANEEFLKRADWAKSIGLGPSATEQDYENAAVAGALKGTIAGAPGLPGSLEEWGYRAKDLALLKTGAISREEYDRRAAAPKETYLPTYGEIAAGAERTLPFLAHQGSTPGSQTVGEIAQFAPAVVNPARAAQAAERVTPAAIDFGRRVVTRMVAPWAGSQVAHEAAAGTEYEPVADLPAMVAAGAAADVVPREAGRRVDAQRGTGEAPTPGAAAPGPGAPAPGGGGAPTLRRFVDRNGQEYWSEQEDPSRAAQQAPGPAPSPGAAPPRVEVLPPETPHGGRTSAGAAATPTTALQQYSPPAQQRWAQLLSDAGITSPELADAAIDRVSQHNMAAEMTPTLESATAGLYAADRGPARNLIASTLNERRVQTPARFASLFDATTAPPVDPEGWRRQIEQQRSQTAGPLWRQFIGTPVYPSPGINDALMGRLQASGALSYANRMLRIEGLPSENGFAVPGEGGEPAEVRVPTAAAFQYAKEYLDGRIEGLLSQPGEAKQALVYTRLRNSVVDALDNHPDPGNAGLWAQARQAWQVPSQQLEAFNVGQRLLTGNIDRYELPYLMEGWTPEQTQAARSGLRAYLEREVPASLSDAEFASRANVRAQSRLMDRILSGDGGAKLQTLLGPQDASQLVAGIAHEERMHTAPQRLIGGSPTAERQAARQAFTAAPPEQQPGAVERGRGVYDRLGQLVRHPIRATIGEGLDAMQRAEDARLQTDQETAAQQAEAAMAGHRDEMARILTSQGPERDALIREGVALQHAPATPPGGAPGAFLGAPAPGAPPRPSPAPAGPAAPSPALSDVDAVLRQAGVDPTGMTLEERQRAAATIAQRSQRTRQPMTRQAMPQGPLSEATQRILGAIADDPATRNALSLAQRRGALPDVQAGIAAGKSDLDIARDANAAGRPMTQTNVGLIRRQQYLDEASRLPLGSHPLEQALSSTPILDAVEAPYPPGSRTVREIAPELRDRGAAALQAMGVRSGRITGPDPFTDELLSRTIAGEVKAALAREGNSSDWYTQKVREATAVASLLHPEIATDPNARFAFTAALAVSSQGERVASNVRLAEPIYAYFKQHGEFPTDVRAKNGPAMNTNFGKLNDLIHDGGGVDYAREFMDRDFTVRDLERDFGHKISGELKDARVRGSAILGPKIGQGFYQNLNGNYDPVTMDLWFTRGWGRLTGTLMDTATPEGLAAQRTRLENALRDAGQRVPQRTDALDRVAQDIFGAHERDFVTNRADYASGARTKSELTYAAERYLDGRQGIKEAPRSGAERQWMRDRIDRARQLLGDDGIPATNADLQAIWWYPEKALYAKMGGESADRLNTDYAGAFSDLARQRGIPDGQIQSAVRAVAGAPQSAVRPVGGGPGPAGPARPQQVPGGDPEGQGAPGAGAGEVSGAPASGTGPQPGGVTSRGTRRQPMTTGFMDRSGGVPLEQRTAAVMRGIADRVAAMDRGEAIPTGPQPPYMQAMTRAGMVGPEQGNAPPFYSAVERAVVSPRAPQRAPAQQWLNTITNTPGVRPEEMQWLGLPEWLRQQQGQVTRDQVLDYVRAHRLEVRMIEPGLVSPEDQERIDEHTHELQSRREEEWAADQIHRPDVDAVRDERGDWHYTLDGDPVDTGGHASRNAAIREGFNAVDENYWNQLHPLLEDAWQHHDEMGLDMEALRREAAEDLGIRAGPRYADGNLVTPGGTNHREFLLTLPEDRRGIERLRQAYADAQRRGVEASEAGDERAAQLAESERVQIGDAFNAASRGYQSSHWDQPRVLAHGRVNDQVVNGRKTLNIDEIQSDWHQQGREQGYDSPEFRLQYARNARALYDARERLQQAQDAAVARYTNGRYRSFADMGGIRLAQDHVTAAVDADPAVAAARQALDAASAAHVVPDRLPVPDAPFKTTWPELMLKRLIRHAAENGYDQIAWTTGKTQADRYNMTRAVQEVTTHSEGPFRDGAEPFRVVTLKPMGSRGVIHLDMSQQGTIKSVYGDGAGGLGADWQGKRLADVVGKEMAEKVLAVPLSEPRTFSGQDLEVGGEGHKTFYDQMLRNIAAKIGRKYGAGVTRGQTEANGTVVHVLPINDALRRAALSEGFPYRRGGAVKRALRRASGGSADDPLWALDIGVNSGPSGNSVSVSRASDPFWSLDLGSNSGPVSGGSSPSPSVVPTPQPRPSQAPQVSTQASGPAPSAAPQPTSSPDDGEPAWVPGLRQDVDRNLSMPFDDWANQPPAGGGPGGGGGPWQGPVAPEDFSGQPMRQGGRLGRASGGRVNPDNIAKRPTEAQKEAGNYAKDHVSVQGLDITVENAKGGIRSGVDRGGKRWQVTMPAHYGYVKGTVGRDGDHVDVYLGPHLKSEKVFVVHQMDADTRRFDEHKVMIGFGSERQARIVYCRGFSDGRAKERMGRVTELTMAQFKAWLKVGDTTKPVTRAA